MEPLLEKAFCIECALSENGIQITDMENLNFLTPYITEGDIDYSGDDDCFQKFVFNPETQKWDKINGDVYYTDDDLIQELERRGYKVFKAEQQQRFRKGELTC